MHATGLSDLLKRSAAARNSIYQHFPGGKEELMVAVTETAGASTAGRIDRLAASNDTVGVVKGLIARWIADMEKTDFNTGCPIAAAALAGPDEPAITAAAAGAFDQLHDEHHGDAARRRHRCRRCGPAGVVRGQRHRGRTAAGTRLPVGAATARHRSDSGSPARLTGQRRSTADGARNANGSAAHAGTIARRVTRGVDPNTSARVSNR